MEQLRIEERAAALPPPPPLENPRDFVPAITAARLRNAVIELAGRQIEAVKLYEPLPVQSKFHACKTRVRIVWGSNRAGKTLAAAVELARAVTGQDPFGKYPVSNGRSFCVANDLSELGLVMYRKLCRPGSFRIIRDQHTNQWRSYRPWEPTDLARAGETKPAPPLLPRRFIKSIAWHSKKESQPSLITLRNGWEISFYSSLGKPPHGADIDLCWFDEEIVDRDWYAEMSARLIDRRGYLIWSATPQEGTEQLYNLHEQAQDERDDPDALVREFFMTLHTNSYVDEQAKKEFIRAVDEEEYRVRVAGEFAISRYLIYPNFKMATHGTPHREIPMDWTIYAAVDPGVQVCAVLFAAVPPPPQDRIVIFDELYMKDCNADHFGSEMARKLAHRKAEAFVIDYHGSVRTEVIGKTIQQQYSDALRKHNVKSNATGFDFHYGSDDVSAGIMAVHSALRVREDGSTKLQVMEGTCPNLVDFEIKRYHYRRERGQVTDRPDQKKHTHLMDALRYLVMMEPRYIKPPKQKARVSPAVAALRAKQERKKQQDGPSHVNIGPGVYARRSHAS